VNRRRLLLLAGLLLAALSACAPPQPTVPPPVPTASSASPSPSAIPSPSPAAPSAAPSASAVTAPTAVTPPTAAPSPVAVPTTASSPGAVPTVAASPSAAPPPSLAPPPSASPATGGSATPAPGGPASPSPTGEAARPYLDDRSGPAQLLRSYASALDRREYLRAYSYWEPDAAAARLGPFPTFADGFAGTASVRLVLGEIGGDAGAGQLYWAVPVELIARQADGAERAFVGCYRLHLARPELQAAPPFRPLAINDASVQGVPAGADPAALLARACAEAGRQPPSLGGTPTDPTDLGPNRYLDDRSTAEQVVRSYYNAVNRREYARAYSYWEEDARPSLPPFDAFVRGYADTDSVRLETGPVAGGAGAGNLYYDLPVVLVARSTGGATRAFVGCYNLHLGQPVVQAQPPFRPLGIRAAALRQTVLAGQPAAGGATPAPGSTPAGGCSPG
jgi:hypothetical protein